MSIQLARARASRPSASTSRSSARPPSSRPTGSLDLARGALDTALDVTRLDAPGGHLTLKAAFSNATRQLDLDLGLQEPKGGVVATLLRIEGTPGDRPAPAGLGAARPGRRQLQPRRRRSDRIAEGVVALRSSDEGLGFNADFAGGLSPLVPAEFRDFFAGASTVKVAGRASRPPAACASTSSTSPAPSCSSTGEPRDRPRQLPAQPHAHRHASATRAARRWCCRCRAGGRASSPRCCTSTTATPAAGTGSLVLDRLQAADIEMEDVTLRLGGLAQNLEDPATPQRHRQRRGPRHRRSGRRSPRSPARSAPASTSSPTRRCNPAGRSTLRQLQVSGNGLSIFSAGAVREPDLHRPQRRSGSPTSRSSPGSPTATLGGAVDLHADGSVSPLSGGFDLTFDGSATDLALGEPRLDPLLAGETTLSGRAVRDEAGIRTEDLRLENPQLSFASNGQISSTRDRHRLRGRALRSRAPRPARRGPADRLRPGDRPGPADRTSPLSASVPEGS